MERPKWRRFLPKKRPKITPESSATMFSNAHTLLETVQVDTFEALDEAIIRFKMTMDQQSASAWLALLILQAPRAAHAQALMDEHPHGYHDREKRLFELIDFNDTFVSTALLLPIDERKNFATRLKIQMDAFCKKMYSKTLSGEQFEAIVHGLSREIAVYHAVKRAGFHVVMTSRAADAFGVDMQIQDAETGRYINVDCKTSSAFHFRLKDLVHQHRIAPHDMNDAEGKGWWEIVNRSENAHVRIILLRINQDDLGEIRDFSFGDEHKITTRIRGIIQQRSISDGQFGRLFVSNE